MCRGHLHMFVAFVWPYAYIVVHHFCLPARPAGWFVRTNINLNEMIPVALSLSLCRTRTQTHAKMCEFSANAAFVYKSSVVR